MIERTYWVTSLHLVQAKMAKICPKNVNKTFFAFNKGHPSFNDKQIHTFKNLQLFFLRELY